MRQTLPKKLFFTISKNLSSADPTWALLVANEYLEPENPLRKALVKKAVTSLASNSSLFDAACQGKRMRELSSEDQLMARRSRSELQRSRRALPSPRARSTQRGVLRSARSVVNG